MSGFKRFLGFALYAFMAFPLMLGGLALSSVRPLAGDSSAVKSLVSDARFAAMLESPELREMAPETVDLGGVSLDGEAAVAGFQASVPSAVVVSTATGAIDAAFAAMARGEAFFSVDAGPLKGALKNGAPVFADVYVAVARPAIAGPTAGDSAGATAIAVPEGAAGLKAVAAVVAEAAEAQPDEWLVGQPGSRFEVPARLGAIGAGLSGASLWLLLTGTGLCFASVMISEPDWRRRLGRMGSRVLAPSVIVLLVGLVPHLVTPGGLIRIPSGQSGASLPAVAEYLRFVATTIGRGFLTAGLIGLGAGTALVSVKRALPPSEEEDID